jgi:hypothetical protein
LNSGVYWVKKGGEGKKRMEGGGGKGEEKALKGRILVLLTSSSTSQSDNRENECVKDEDDDVTTCVDWESGHGEIPEQSPQSASNWEIENLRCKFSTFRKDYLETPCLLGATSRWEEP